MRIRSTTTCSSDRSAERGGIDVLERHRLAVDEQPPEALLPEGLERGPDRVVGIRGARGKEIAGRRRLVGGLAVRLERAGGRGNLIGGPGVGRIGRQGGNDRQVEAQDQSCARRQLQQLRRHDLGGLADDFQAALTAIGPADARKQQPHVVVDLGDRADRRPRIPHAVLLADRDRRTDAVDPIDVGLLHPLEELARVRRQRLDVAALPLGIDGVEGERRLARPADAGDDDQPAGRQRDVDVLEVMGAGAAHHDGAGWLHGSECLVGPQRARRADEPGADPLGRVHRARLKHLMLALPWTVGQLAEASSTAGLSNLRILSDRARLEASGRCAATVVEPMSSIAVPSGIDRDEAIARYRQNRARTAQLFDLLTDDAYYAQPISLRHPIVFYEGHLPGVQPEHVRQEGARTPRHRRIARAAVRTRHRSRRADGAAAARRRRGRIAAGARVRRRGRSLVLDALATADLDVPGHPLLDGAAAVHTILEHESMHQETLLYMWHRLPLEQKRAPAGLPRREHAAPRVRAAGHRRPRRPGAAGRGARRDPVWLGQRVRSARARRRGLRASIASTSPTKTSSGSSRPAATPGRSGGPHADWAWVVESQLQHPSFWEKRDGDAGRGSACSSGFRCRRRGRCT